MAAQTSSQMEEVAHAFGKVVSIDRITAQVKDVATAPCYLWTTMLDPGAQPSLLITCGSWAYPLCGQPVLRIGPGKYVLSCPPDEGGVRQYVLTLYSGEALGDAEALADFEAAVEARTTLRNGGGAPGAAAVAPEAAAAASGHSGDGVLALPSMAPPTSLEKGATYLGAGIRLTGAGLRTAMTTTARAVGYGVEATATAIAARVPAAAPPPQATETAAPAAPAPSASVQIAGNVRTFTRAVAATTRVGVGICAELARNMGTWVAAAALEAPGARQALEDAGASPAGAAVKTVAASSLVAFKDVWDGLEEAARLVGGAAGAAAHTLVEARYGDDANALRLTDAVVGIGGDLGEAALNWRGIGPRVLLRSAAVEAAAATLGVDGAGKPQQLPPIGGGGGGGGGGEGGGSAAAPGHSAASRGAL